MGFIGKFRDVKFWAGFILQKGKLWKNLVANFQCLKGLQESWRGACFPRICSDGIWANGFKMQ